MHKKGFLKEGNCVDSCPNEEYYIDNSACLKCHDNCLTCESGIEIDNTGQLINMKCTSCKNSQSQTLKMILNEGNCFQ